MNILTNIINYSNILVILIFFILLLLFFIFYFHNTTKCYEWNNCNLLDQQKLINTFEKNGVIIIPEVFTQDVCDKLLDILKKKENNYYGENKNETKTEIASQYKRKNIVMPTNECREYITDIYNKLKYFFDILTPNPILVDCACFITEPGCFPQAWHRDTLDSTRDFITTTKYANQISIGITLEDVDETLGPLEVFLKTNKLYQNEYFLFEKYNDTNIKYDKNGMDINCIYKDNHILRGMCKDRKTQTISKSGMFKKVKCTCKKGSLVLWSSKVIHRGGQNIGNKNRPVFYITFMGNNGDNPMDFDPTTDRPGITTYLKDL